MGRSLVLAAVAAASAAAFLGGVSSAGGSNGLQMGIADSAETLEQPDRAFPLYSQLDVGILRVTLYWGSTRGVARRRPEDGVDPADPAYDWRAFDRAVLAAHDRGIRIVFAIWGTPGWANGGNPPNRAPRNPVHLQAFAYAAATRYSGTYTRDDGVTLPAVRQWIAWNEPNLRLGLVPQWRRVNHRWVPQSAYDYADICSAITNGVHMTLLKSEQVACGATAARGNNNPRAHWASVGPMGFLRAMRAAGVRRLDAYAHHAYAGGPREAPWAKPRNATAVTLGNIDRLVKEVTRLYGRKPIWITEYGYETSPQDTTFGVPWSRQASYLTAAFEIARKNPRIQMMLWFLLRDEGRFRGWQSGLVTSKLMKKPAFWAFQREALRLAAIRSGAGAG
jgi:Glycosyl hydrolase catalytic core